MVFYLDIEVFDQRLLQCLKDGKNEEAISILQNIENFQCMVDYSGSTLLHYAAKYGNAVMVQHLIDKGCDVNAHDGDGGFTPLMFAGQNADAWTVNILLNKNADIYVTDDNGWSVLKHFSFRFSYYLWSSLNMNKQNGWLILEMLFQRVNRDVLKDGQVMARFLRNASNEVKLAATVLGDVELAKFVLKNGYPIDFRDSVQGYTALHCAIIAGKIENTKILLEYGANVAAVDECSKSPLHYYTYKFEAVDKKFKVLKLILEHGAKLKDWSNDQAFKKAVELLLTTGTKKIVKTVLRSGLDVGSKFGFGKSLLQLLTENKNEDVLDLLVDLDIKFHVDLLDASLSDTSF